jgi:hypothetical protein
MKLLTGLDVGDTDDEQLARTWIAAHELRLQTPESAEGRARDVAFPESTCSRKR